MAAAKRAAKRPAKREFHNNTQGWLGVVKINRKGDEVGQSVAPGTRVFLTGEEVELTRQAHAHEVDSPFQAREIIHYDGRSGDEVRRFTAPMLEEVTKGSQPAGAYADGEETGTAIPAGAQA